MTQSDSAAAKRLAGLSYETAALQVKRTRFPRYRLDETLAIRPSRGTTCARLARQQRVLLYGRQAKCHLCASGREKWHGEHWFCQLRAISAARTCEMASAVSRPSCSHGTNPTSVR